MTFAIRRTREGDAPLLSEVERSAGSRFREATGLEWIAEEPTAPEDLHRRYAAGGTSWVAADENDRPFGFLVAERFGDELHIWEVDVRRDRQGQGAGRALLEAAFACARAQGLAAVTLTTFRGVAWNEPFYARLGFTTLAEDRLGERLAHVIADERARGYPAGRRCAMRLEFSYPGEGN